VFVAWQQAVNGLVSQAAQDSMVATTVNFTVGTGALLLEVVLPAGPTGSLVFPVVGTVLALVAVMAGLSDRRGSARMTAAREERE
jgi:uncharacterized membrane protein